MQKRVLILIFLSICSAYSIAQVNNTLNQTDASGKKQGHWVKRYVNGIIQYDGYFLNDTPVGEFKRFYEDSQLRSVQIFSADGSEAQATFYHQNGFIASTGKYLNQKKEGIWKTYSADFDKYLISEETYSGDKRNGSSLKFYPGGSVLEKLTFVNDQRQGEWTQYYSDGTTAIKSFYQNDKLQGPYEVFFPDGKTEFSGQYKNDVRDSLWHIYNKDGSLKYDITYTNGVVNNPELFRTESDYLDSLEKNKGKIAEPDINDIQF